MFGDADHVVDYGKEQFGIDALHWTALQGIHAVVHRANVGTKYTWFGPGYLSNMFFKMLANKPTYRFENGGDLSFGKGMNLWHTAVGDENGNPVAQTGWYVVYVENCVRKHHQYLYAGVLAVCMLGTPLKVDPASCDPPQQQQPMLLTLTR